MGRLSQAARPFSGLTRCICAFARASASSPTETLELRHRRLLGRGGRSAAARTASARRRRLRRRRDWLGAASGARAFRAPLDAGGKPKESHGRSAPLRPIPASRPCRRRRSENLKRPLSRFGPPSAASSAGKNSLVAAAGGPSLGVAHRSSTLSRSCSPRPVGQRSTVSPIRSPPTR